MKTVLDVPIIKIKSSTIYDVNDIEKPIIQPDLESPMMLSDLKTMLDDEDDLYDALNNKGEVKE